jgi:pyruvate, orthophosphate dikinase
MHGIGFVHELAHDDTWTVDELNAAYGGKASSLVRMIRAGYGDLVPPAFVIPCGRCSEFEHNQQLTDSLVREFDAAVDKLESVTGTRFGSPEVPLIVSVRSGAAVSMPGLMTTVLNVGCTGDAWSALAEHSEQFAAELLYQFLIGLGELARISDGGYDSTRTTGIGVADVMDLAGELMQQSTVEFDLRATRDLLLRCVEGVFRSWNSEGARAIRDRDAELMSLPGTAVTVQQMRYGNFDDNSGSGVIFSRDPSTGHNMPRIDFVKGEQGDVLVSGLEEGIHTDAFAKDMKHHYDQLIEITNALEEEWRGAVDVEFTVEADKLYLLQCRRAVLSGPGTLRAVLEMLDTEPGMPDTGSVKPLRLHFDEAIALLQPQHFENSMYRRLQPRRGDEQLAKGEPAGPGAVTGDIIFSSERLRANHNATGKVDKILVTDATSPKDVPGMTVAAGYLTRTGGALAHAALMARKLSKPAVVGVRMLRIDHAQGTCEFTTPNGKRVLIHEGERISIDGTTGKVFKGDVAINETIADGDIKDVAVRLREYYLDAADSPVDVYVNGDTRDAVHRGLGFGARGVGLVRTEAMRHVERALESLRGAVRRTDPLDDADVEALERAHYDDFCEILDAVGTGADTKALSIRLLDDTELTRADEIGGRVAVPETLVDLVRARIGGANGRVDKHATPSLAHRARGVRIALVHKQIYPLQVRALLRAIEHHHLSDPRIELVVPMVIDPLELRLVRSIVKGEVERWKTKTSEGWTRPWKGPELSVMIETPRAAELAGEFVAEGGDRFSLGTNDLTQMVFGFDRDDVGGHVLNRYFEEKILLENPFSVLDRAVARMVEQAVASIRAVKESSLITVSGEHAAEESAVAFFTRIGVNVLSCAPDRVPVAWLLLAKSLFEAPNRTSESTSCQPVADMREAVTV